MFPPAVGIAFWLRIAVADSSARPVVLSTAASEQPLVVRELLARVVGAGGVRDRHQIVRAEALLDELLRGRLRPLQPQATSVCRSSITMT